MFFSIVVPIYNAQKFIKRAVESIQNQTFQDYELILVDDGSSDKSAEMIDAYGEQDERIKVIHKKNGGVSSARNCGIEHASGTYLICMDADDKYDQNALQVLADTLKKTNPDLLSFGYHEVIIENGQTISSSDKGFQDHFYHVAESKKELLSVITEIPFRAVWNKAFKLEIIKQNNIKMDETLFLGEDYCFNLEVLEHCSTFQTMKNPLYYYLIENQTSIIQRYNKNKFDQMYRVHVVRTKNIRKNQYGDTVEREADISYDFVRLCISCFMDFFRKECKLSFKEQLAFIRKALNQERPQISMEHLKVMSLPKKVIYCIFATKSRFLIWLVARVSFMIKFKLGKTI